MIVATPAEMLIVMTAMNGTLSAYAKVLNVAEAEYNVDCNVRLDAVVLLQCNAPAAQAPDVENH